MILFRDPKNKIQSPEGWAGLDEEILLLCPVRLESPPVRILMAVDFLHGSPNSVVRDVVLYGE